MFSSAIVKQTMGFRRVTQEVMNGASSREQHCDLVAGIVEGDESAARDLYNLHGQHLYAYARRLTSDPALAQDVLQAKQGTAWGTARSLISNLGQSIVCTGPLLHGSLNKANNRHALNDIREIRSVPPVTTWLPAEQVVGLRGGFR